MSMTLAALSLTAAGALLVYLASPNQRLIDAVAHPAVIRGLGFILLVAGGWAWHAVLGFDLLATIFVTLTLTMLAWVALPYGDAGIRILRARHSGSGPERQ